MLSAFGIKPTQAAALRSLDPDPGVSAPPPHPTPPGSPSVVHAAGLLQVVVTPSPAGGSAKPDLRRR